MSVCDKFVFFDVCYFGELESKDINVIYEDNINFEDDVEFFFKVVCFIGWE